MDAWVERAGGLLALGHFHASGQKGDLTIIGHWFTRRAASALDLLFQEENQLVGFWPVGREEVLTFSAVLLEVVELHRGKFLLLGFRFTRGAPSTAARGKAQFPVALANGERPPDGMTYQSGPAGARLPLEGRKQAEGIFSAVGLDRLSGDLPHGVVQVGLDERGLEYIAERDDVEKCGIADIAAVTALGAHGATTVSASIRLAALAGIKMFATGGLGGVHLILFTFF